MRKSRSQLSTTLCTSVNLSAPLGLLVAVHKYLPPLSQRFFPALPLPSARSSLLFPVKSPSHFDLISAFCLLFEASLFPVSLSSGLQTFPRRPSWASVSPHLGRWVRQQMHQISIQLLKLEKEVKLEEQGLYVLERSLQLQCGE